MITHPLMDALQTAGAMTQTVARTITNRFYGPIGMTEAGMIANALVEDQTGYDNKHDNYAASDRYGTVDSRRAARERMAHRTEIARIVFGFLPAQRNHFFAQLANGHARYVAIELSEHAESLTANWMAKLNAHAASAQVAS